jgi:hypothetical protein
MAKAKAGSESETLQLPEWINKESWQAFEAMRKKIKKPMSLRAAKMIIRSLENLRHDGDDPNLVLDQSELNSWQDVYPLKPDWLKKIGKNRDGTDRIQRSRPAGPGRPVDPNLGNF